MSLKAFYDLVYFSTATTGTGSITVGSAQAGAQLPATAGAVDGDVVSYAIKDGSNYETGSGTLSSTATVLSRDTVYTSSSSGSKITLSGSALVNFCVLATDVGNNSGIGDMVRLAQVVTTGSQATVDFTSIPSNFTSLKVTFTAQDTQNGTSSVTLAMKINNDGTSGNYTSTGRSGTVNTTNVASQLSPSSAGGAMADISQSTTAAEAAYGEIWLHNYANTTFHKVAQAFSAWDSATFASSLIWYMFRWKNTAAINRLTFTTTGTPAFTNGSVFTLYGIK